MAVNLGTVPPHGWQDVAYIGRLGCIKCTDDVVIPIARQHSMFKGAGGRGKWVTHTLEGSGHSTFLSQLYEVAATEHS
ncbi:hypothetical protein N7457_009046 [Penicillium paradoxum]|uniref:uncharacterized protein n=1 Tax=Penicillium paradoxum TaxID=176176 RepID=UPI0025466F59|nr:uncharacterized protein N7457_009046 [Penicillium paradoxum]KAJ5774150.1 hypothetical protein N7457_009046 [Penicillium paradoxum]